MSDPIIIPPEIQPALNERTRLWTDIKSFENTVNAMTELGRQIPAGMPGPAITALTDMTDLPREVTAVTSALRFKLGEIGSCDTQIKDMQNQIAIIQQKKQQQIILMVVGGIILLLFLLALFTTFL